MNTLDNARGHLARTRVCGTEVKGDIAGDTEGLSLMVENVRHLGVLQQRLGWNTANIEADTAPVLLLHHSSLQTQLGCTDCCDVSARTAAEYYKIKMFSHVHKSTHDLALLHLASPPGKPHFLPSAVGYGGGHGQRHRQQHG